MKITTEQAAIIKKVREVFFHQSTVFAEMWLSKDGGKYGYSPVCQHGKFWECKKQNLVNEKGPKCGENCRNFKPLPLSDQAIILHLAGEVTLGAYLLDEADTCGMGLIDLDIPKDAADPEAARLSCQEMARLIYRIATSMGLAVYLEDSGSKGYHAWTFFSEAMPAGEVQRLGKLIAALAQDELTVEGIGIEVFPKQREKDRLGNLVKIPFSIHKKTGRKCLFLDPETFEPYADDRQIEVLMTIEANTPDLAREILEEYGQKEEKVSNRNGHRSPEESNGNLPLVEDAIGAILENCQVANDLKLKAVESSNLSHDERRFLAKTFKAIGQQEWAISHIFRFLENFDPDITEKQFSSFGNAGPNCSNYCAKSCENIQSRPGAISPISFAYKRRKETLPDPDSLQILLTEYGNARRLKAILQNQIAYSPGFGWMLYNPEIGIWENEPGTERIRGLVTSTLRQLFEAELKKMEDKLEKLKKEIEEEGESDLFAEPSEKTKKAKGLKKKISELRKWLKSCEGHGKISGTLKFCEGLFWKNKTIWDAMSDILVCGNGVLDLDSLEFTSFKPSFYATKRTPVPWKPGATHPAWDKMIELLQKEGDRFQRIKRICGSLLFAGNPKEFVAIFEGDAGTGKGTLITAVHKAMGDYAQSIDIGSLLETDYRHQGKGSPRADLFKLRGARFVFTGEPPKDAKLDAGAVKKMSGNDPIDARQPYAVEEVTFYPLYKIIIQTNFHIRVDWDDPGMKRRLIVVPFTVKPEKPDPAVKNALMFDPEAQAAVLAWLVKEHREWRDADFDLGESETVEKKTQAYWKGNNPFSDFAADCLAFVKNAKVRKSAMRKAYTDWCEKTGSREEKARDFNTWLRAQPGIREDHIETGDIWENVGLKTKPEQTEQTE